ncbi:VirB3 family type IV secretion system protein [Comamonas sp. w2-DMI]|uniref:VirB3 family type IV secretion system protein n=1 Tax=Comamonas sp. w2-DMI TaxID=3126391 RepID=UPI0032E403ED
MARRSSNSRRALKREKLYIGIPKNAFYLLLLIAIGILVFRKYLFLPSLIIIWFAMKKATQQDTAFIELFQSFSKEKHIYDSLPRKSIWEKLPRGWGKGLPW